MFIRIHVAEIGDFVQIIPTSDQFVYVEVAGIDKAGPDKVNILFLYQFLITQPTGVSLICKSKVFGFQDDAFRSFDSLEFNCTQDRLKITDGQGKSIEDHVVEKIKETASDYISSRGIEASRVLFVASVEVDTGAPKLGFQHYFPS